MTPLVLTHFTATSAIGRGLDETLDSLQAQRSGLAPCQFETVRLDTYVGEVEGVDQEQIAPGLREFACRNNRLAQLGLTRDDFTATVEDVARRWGRHRVGVFLGTSTSGILETELAYRRRDPATGALPAGFHYRGAHNSFSVADCARHYLGLEGPAVVGSSACASSAN